MNVTERITLRLPQNLLHILRKESEERILPINALIVRILHKNLIQETKFATLPAFSIPPYLFVKIIAELDDSKIQDISNSEPKLIKKFFTLVNRDYTVENIVSEYFVMLARHYNWFLYSFEKSEHQYRLVFDTCLEENWTKFVFNHVKTTLLAAKAHIEKESINDNVAVFMIRDYKVYL